MKAPMFFLNSCGCPSGSPYPQPCGSVPQLPAMGTRVCDDRYFTLATSPGVQLLGVPSGSNCQTFLQPIDSSGESFLVQGTDGQVRPSRSPMVALPVINAPTGGNYPQPSGFQFLLLSGAGNAMKRVAAPTAGNWILQAQNGSWVVVDAGTIPGINAVASSSEFAANGQILVTVQTAPGVYAVKKLQPVINRAVVAFDDGSGNISYRSLPDMQALQHPIGRFSTLGVDKLTGLDSNGAPVSFPQGAATGDGALSDWTLVGFSPSSTRVAKAPLRTAAYTSSDIISGVTAAPTGYQNLPSGHGVLPSANYEYPNALIMASVALGAAALVKFALFRDGVQIHEFNTRGLYNGLFQYIDKNVPRGTHVYDLRWKRGLADQAETAVFTYSDVSAISLP